MLEFNDVFGNTRVLINPAHIVYVEEFAEDPDHCAIYTTTKRLVVRQSYETVRNLIDQKKE